MNAFGVRNGRWPALTVKGRGGLQRTLRRSGFDLVRYPQSRPGHKRVALLRHHRIEVVLDVGANDGGYARELREFGYEGRIVSFEPLGGPYERLRDAATGDPLWTAVNMALGEHKGRSTMNVSANAVSSSFLAMHEEHRLAAPQATYVRTEDVQVSRLDDVFDDYCNQSTAFLKMDVQGYEERVLRGGTRALSLVEGVQIEMSLVPLYEGAWLFVEAVQFLAAAGFRLVSLEPGFANPATGQLLQVDGIFMGSGRRHPRHVAMQR